MLHNNNDGMVPTPDLNNNKWKISFFEEEFEFLFTLIMVRVPKYTNQITKSFQVNHPFNAYNSWGL